MSLKLYYYSRHKDDDYEQDPHFTKYTRQSSEFALNIKKDYQDSANQKNKQ